MGTYNLPRNVKGEGRIFFIFSDNTLYEVTIFCDEFERIYNFETDEEQLSEQERTMFRSLSKMAGRFSEFEEDLKIPNMYFSGDEILAKVREEQSLRF